MKMSRPHLTLTLPYLFLILSPIVLASGVIHESDSSLTAQSQLDLGSEPHQEVLLSSDHTQSDDGGIIAFTNFDPLEELRNALDVMQDSWFEVWVGTWPAGIDWTRAVIDTLLVSSLNSLGKAARDPSQSDHIDPRDLENEINKYFTQNVVYYFGEDAFALRNQAYDDMLWVVLGWLESVKFIKSHSDRQNPENDTGDSRGRPKLWHGHQFVKTFAHRAHVFYDLASRGWDTDYCGGGMVWSPYLGPYKNAITNELFISASVGMYLHFPGDNNTSPFMLDGVDTLDLEPSEPFDPKYLTAAVEGYKWLKKSKMTNQKGLYIDGLHVSNWKNNGTKCDNRDTMVYTYNQGVILSGLRGLWEATGNITYLEDGHELARNVIKATGWDFKTASAEKTDNWAGLGRNGILEDHCDALGRCNQDAQTFKGIFFHHLKLFCEPLPLKPVVPGKTHCAIKDLAYLHKQSCREYTYWVAHNAHAALSTKDDNGRFGMWWGVAEDADAPPLPEGATDYRNNPSELLEPLWQRDIVTQWSSAVQRYGGGNVLNAEGRLRPSHSIAESQKALVDEKKDASNFDSDPNNRGRGRTVESHSGGVAVLCALVEMLGFP